RQFRKELQCCNQNTKCKGHNGPKNSGIKEILYDSVIVLKRLHLHYESILSFTFLSSLSILTAGDSSSSNCPFLAPIKNSTKNTAAKETLAITIKITIPIAPTNVQ